MRLLAVLSLWENLESVYAFTYHGLHGEVFGRRQEWFVPKRVPDYVAWWVADDHTPTWQEASTRYDQLHQASSSATAFDFKKHFTPEGNPITLDRKLIKRKSANYQTAV